MLLKGLEIQACGLKTEAPATGSKPIGNNVFHGFKWIHYYFSSKYTK